MPVKVRPAILRDVFTIAVIIGPVPKDYGEPIGLPGVGVVWRASWNKLRSPDLVLLMRGELRAEELRGRRDLSAALLRSWTWGAKP